MKIYILHIELERFEETEIAGAYSSEEKAEVAGRKIEEQCKEHDIYKYGFNGWYVTMHDLDDEEEPEEKKEDPTETERLKNICRVMFNRCKVTGSLNGAMCVWCGLRKECKEMSGPSNKEGRMANV